MRPPKSVISFVLVTVLALSGCVSEQQQFATIVSSFDQSIAEDDLLQARELFEGARLLAPESEEIAVLGRRLQIIELSKKAFLSAETSSASGKDLAAVISYLEVSEEDFTRFEQANSNAIAILRFLIFEELGRTGDLTKKELINQGLVLEFIADFPEERTSLLDYLGYEVEMLAESYREELSAQINLAIREKRLTDAERLIDSGMRALPKDKAFADLAGEIDDLLREQRVLQAAVLKRERAAALSAMFIVPDTFEGVDWYYDRATYSRFAGDKFMLYIGKQGSSKPWLRLQMMYYGSDWVFWDTLTVSVDGEKFYFNPGYIDVKRNNDSRVWEWYDIVPDASDLKMIRKIIDSNNTTLRFQGEFYADRVLSTAQKRALKNVLLAFDALGG